VILSLKASSVIVVIIYQAPRPVRGDHVRCVLRDFEGFDDTSQVSLPEMKKGGKDEEEREAWGENGKI
jgi:hypothetical protein